MTTELSKIGKDNVYPIAEIFTSPQGEGVYQGVAMTFIRLAGCTVGKPYSYHHRDILNLPIYTEKCTLYDHREFPCDTNYKMTSKMHPRLIMEEIPKDVGHVCITGGEPLMHDLNSLIQHIQETDRTIHIETSGTIYKYFTSDVWVTVSPKINPWYEMIYRSNEIKLLVDQHFDIKDPIASLFEDTIREIDLIQLAKEKIVYLQPVNFEKTINEENLDICLNLQQEYPMFRVCYQQHKYMSAAIHKEVR